MTRNRERKKKDISDLRGIQKTEKRRQTQKKSETDWGIGEGREGRGEKSVKGSGRAENAKRPMCIVSPPTLI